MSERIMDARDKAKNYWTSLDNKKRSRIVLFAVLFVIFVAVAGVILTKTNYTVLYSDLELKEAGEIMTVLGEMGINAKTSDSGTILIDEKLEDTVRMQLAVQGYPKSGLNYDIYQNSLDLTSSNQDKSIMLNYQLQDRLSNTISQLYGIKTAIVTITSEENDIFQFKNDDEPISASVVLELENNFQPDQQQINAIIHLMITSVSNLKRENVAVIDTNLRDLSNADSSSPFNQEANSYYTFENDIENQITQKILDIFEPVFGSDNIKVGCNATIDFDKKVTEIIEYSPVLEDTGIPYVIDELSEKISDSSLNTSQVNSDYTVQSDSLNDRVQKVINYRINELKQTIDGAPGSIEDMTVSILLNGIDQDQTILEDVRKIAAAAIGIDGSKVTVSYMEFSAQQALQDKINQAIDGSSKSSFPLSERTIVGLVALLFAFIFGIMLINVFRKKPVRNVEQLQTPEGIITDEMLLDDISIDLKREVLSPQKMEQLAREKETINEIENLAKNNPKDIAQIISYLIKEDK